MFSTIIISIILIILHRFQNIYDSLDPEFYCEVWEYFLEKGAGPASATEKHQACKLRYPAMPCQTR